MTVIDGHWESSSWHARRAQRPRGDSLFRATILKPRKDTRVFWKKCGLGQRLPLPPTRWLKVGIAVKYIEVVMSIVLFSLIGKALDVTPRAEKWFNLTTEHGTAHLVRCISQVQKIWGLSGTGKFGIFGKRAASFASSGKPSFSLTCGDLRKIFRAHGRLPWNIRCKKKIRKLQGVRLPKCHTSKMGQLCFSTSNMSCLWQHWLHPFCWPQEMAQSLQPCPKPSTTRWGDHRRACWPSREPVAYNGRFK